MPRRALLLLPILLFACGGDDEGGETTTTAAPQSTTSSTEEEETATVGQYASIVAEVRPDILSNIASAEDCLFLWEPYACDIAGGLSTGTVGINAQRLEVGLTAAAEDRPNNRLYIGRPPDELERLVEDTITDAREVIDGADQFNKENCAAQPGAEVEPTNACPEAAATLSLALSSLENQLRAWEPYI